MRAPWNKSKAEISEYTDWDVQNLLFRPGTEEATKKGYYWPVRDWTEEDEADLAAAQDDFRAVAFFCYRQSGMTDLAEMEAKFDRDYPSYGKVSNGR